GSSSNPIEDQGHDTATAGFLVAGEYTTDTGNAINDRTFSGIAPGAKVMPLRIIAGTSEAPATNQQWVDYANRLLSALTWLQTHENGTDSSNHNWTLAAVNMSLLLPESPEHYAQSPIDQSVYDRSEEHTSELQSR